MAKLSEFFPSGGGLKVDFINTATATAEINTLYIIDTSLGNVTVTLPLNPPDGSIVGLIDGKGNNFATPTGFGLNSCAVTATSPNTIQGWTTVNLLTENSSIQLIFHGDRWHYLSWDRNFSIDQFKAFNSPTSKDVSTNYTLTNDDHNFWIKASGSITITAHTSPRKNFEVIIQNVGTGTITISGVSNAVGTKITSRWRACHLYYDGTAWYGVGALET